MTKRRGDTKHASRNEPHPTLLPQTSAACVAQRRVKRPEQRAEGALARVRFNDGLERALQGTEKTLIFRMRPNEEPDDGVLLDDTYGSPI